MSLLYNIIREHVQTVQEKTIYRYSVSRYLLQKQKQIGYITQIDSMNFVPPLKVRFVD